MKRTAEIGTGSSVFYQNRHVRTGIVHCSFRMTDPVSGEALQHAVDTMFPRYPHHFTRLVESDGRFLLETMEEPYRVLESETPVAAGSPEVGGCLTAVSYWKDTIWSSFNHGVSDGGGLTAYWQTLLYYYCLYRYGGPLESPGVILADTPFFPDEFTDPFDVVDQKMPKEPLALHFPETFFLLPEERVGADEPHTLFTVRINQKEFMRFSKAVDGSPAVITALFLSRAIDRIHPDRNEPLCVKMCADLRDILGLPHTVRNCFDTLTLHYSDRLKSFPLDRQATCFRGMVFSQMMPEYAIPHFKRQKDMADRVGALPTLEAKLGSYSASPVPVVSYTGRMDFGGIERYRTEHLAALASPDRGITIEIFTSGEDFSICFISSMKSDLYYRAFLRELEDAAVPYREGKPKPFLIPYRDFREE